MTITQRKNFFNGFEPDYPVTKLSESRSTKNLAAARFLVQWILLHLAEYPFRAFGAHNEAKQWSWRELHPRPKVKKSDIYKLSRF